MIPEAQALTGKRPRDVADEHAREEEARAMMARFIAPIKREFLLSHDGGAGCESGARKRENRKDAPKPAANTPAPAVTGTESAQRAGESTVAEADVGKASGHAVSGENDGVERPDRETVLALRQQRKEQRKKSKQEERGRGQNKSRDRDHKAGLNKRVNAALPSLCKKISRGLACPYGDKCKFSHDIAAYLENAKLLPDLPIACPFASSTPPRRCIFGLSCRATTCRETFATKMAASLSAHVLPGHEEAIAENAGGEEGLTVHEDEVNHLPRSVQAQLREVKGKGKYIYHKWHVQHAAYKKGLASQRQAAAKTSTSHGDASGVGALQEFGRSEADSDAPASMHVQDAEPAEAKTTKCDSAGNGDVSAYEIGAHLRAEEKKRLDFDGKTILAPLTTVGNLPFRRLCKGLGCDVTYGEMALASKIIEGNSGEWALFRRHKTEDMFGIQIAGAFADNVARCAEIFERECQADFFDLNCGCPIDQVTSKGMGAELLDNLPRLREIVTVASRSSALPMTVKIRVGHYEDAQRRMAHKLIPLLSSWGASAVTLHGRSRQQRYNRLADWDYISECAAVARTVGVPLLGNGDVVSWEDYAAHMACGNLSSCMVARGALIKPWIFTEIKESRYWDIRSGERLELIKDFCRFGLDHWGSDSVGVEKTRSFLCEWQAWLCRYVPVGLLEVLPPKMNHRNPGFVPRDDLEGLLAGDQVEKERDRASERVRTIVPAHLLVCLRADIG